MALISSISLTIIPVCIRYTTSSSGKTSFVFDIPSQNCGTEMDSNDNSIELSNTIVIQNDENVQEIWDIARHVKCEWVERYSKEIKFNSFAVGMLDAEEVIFEGGDKLECWMDIQLGSYPKSTNINTIVKIGDTLSLLIYLRDNKKMYDVSVKDCYAYGNYDYENFDTPKIQLTNENGCVIKEKLISNFYTTREESPEGSIIVSYAYVNAFKFPDVMDVYISCNINICKEQCDQKCGADIVTTTKSPDQPRSGSTLFGEPIYTLAPEKCLPGSTDPVCSTPSSLVFDDPCILGSQDPKCYKNLPTGTSNECTDNSDDQKCQKNKSDNGSKCIPGSKDLNCLPKRLKIPTECIPPNDDPRCLTSTTTASPNCIEGSSDPRCLKASTFKSLKCYPGTKDPRCIKITTLSPECYPGSTEPKCIKLPIKCHVGSKHPECLKLIKEPTNVCDPNSSDSKCQKEPPPKCLPGSKDPKCLKQFDHFPHNTLKPDCSSDSKDQRCITTKQPRPGSTLFSEPLTTKTKNVNKFSKTTVPTTQKLKETLVTRRPLSPSLKPDPSNKIKNRVFASEREPKSSPEPSDEEWKGNPRFHAFHRFHYEKGDGRRNERIKNKITLGSQINRNIRSVSSNNNIKKTKKLKTRRSFLVAPLSSKSTIKIKRDTSSEKIMREIYSEKYLLSPSVGDSICISLSLFTVGLSLLIFAFFTSTTIAIILIIRLENNKN